MTKSINVKQTIKKIEKLEKEAREIFVLSRRGRFVSDQLEMGMSIAYRNVLDLLEGKNDKET